MNLSREQLQKVRESLKAGSFSDKWWKLLKKDINKCKLSKEDKILIYGCIIRGLLDECYKLAKNEQDYEYCHKLLEEIIRMPTDYSGYDVEGMQNE